MSAAACAGGRFPPVRGGGPYRKSEVGPVTKFSPGARGWTGCHRRGHDRLPVFPRCAGVDRRPWPWNGSSRCFPPVRGGGPKEDLLIRLGRRFSPGARGWTEDPIKESVISAVFPRCAGVDRAIELRSDVEWRFPPVCGGGPIEKNTADVTTRFLPACGGGPFALQWDRRRRQFSPGVRGWTEIWIDRQIVRGVFPRRAGVDRPGSPGRRHRGRFPPACGGGPKGWWRISLIGRFSPGVRGWTVLLHLVRDELIVFPRRAGVDRRRSGPRGLLSGFPPACGGGPLYRGRSSAECPFSPGVRGWTGGDGSRLDGLFVIPRRAGVDRRLATCRAMTGRFPPACGLDVALARLSAASRPFPLRTGVD